MMFGKEKSEDCPLWRGPCKEHKCRWYIQVLGKNPQSDETISKFGCAIEFLPMLMVENAQQSRQTAASIDRLNNDVVNMNGIAAVQNSILARDAALLEVDAQNGQNPPKLIGKGQ